MWQSLHKARRTELCAVKRTGILNLPARSADLGETAAESVNESSEPKPDERVPATEGISPKDGRVGGGAFDPLMLIRDRLSERRMLEFRLKPPPNSEDGGLVGFNGAATG